MQESFRPGVKIVKSPEFLAPGIQAARDPEERRDRDNRPGRYSITGAFIKLPEDERHTDRSRD